MAAAKAGEGKGWGAATSCYSTSRPVGSSSPPWRSTLPRRVAARSTERGSSRSSHSTWARSVVRQYLRLRHDKPRTEGGGLVAGGCDTPKEGALSLYPGGAMADDVRGSNDECVAVARDEKPRPRRGPRGRTTKRRSAFKASGAGAGRILGSGAVGWRNLASEAGRDGLRQGWLREARWRRSRGPVVVGGQRRARSGLFLPGAARMEAEQRIG